jgi:hypothetical protein
VESSVVVYLRLLYYPEGFAFPLKPGIASQIVVELAREFATIVMLVSVGMLAGRTRWQRFSYFMIGFGVWDILYYVWLKVMLNWPSSLFDWDVLFLIPVPWIGPVIAPVLVSIAMIAGGLLILRKEEQSGGFHTSWKATLPALAGSAVILWSFVLDVNASMRFQYPAPYHYELLAMGMVGYAIAFAATARRGAIGGNTHADVGGTEQGRRS